MTNAIKALLFDIDGTLADTEADGHRPAYNQAFRAMGLDWDWSPAKYRELLSVAGGRERLAHYLDVYAPPLGRHAQALERDRAGWIESVHRSKTRFFRQRLAGGAIAPRPGVVRLLKQALAAGIDIAFVTNATANSLQLMLTHLLPPQLQTCASARACGDEVAAKKPAPDLYRLALQKLGHAPADCVAIEDAASGLRSALAAGVPAVVAVNEDTCDQDFDGALLVVDHLGEPERHCRAISGPPPAAGYVDLALLGALRAGTAAGDK